MGNFKSALLSWKYPETGMGVMAELQLNLVDKPTFAELMIERGLQAENNALGLEPPQEIAVYVRDDHGRIMGGVQGELEWGWMYVDLVWLHEDLRGQGMGRRMMTAIEQGALAHGFGHCWLATTAFQARPFYMALGYELAGTVEDRPPGYDYYFLYRSPIRPEASDLPVWLDPEQEDIDVLRHGLANHTRQQGVVVDGKRLAVFLEDEQGGVYGGLVAATYWGWLDIQAIWLTESIRGQGYGSQMLAMAEAESLRRNCPHAFADVASFQSLGFFQTQGYHSFGALEGRPPGYQTHFMRKALRP